MKKLHVGSPTSKRTSSSDDCEDESWGKLQYDADNWLEVPEFDADPKSLEFKGFAFPVVTAGKTDSELRRIAYQSLKSARWAMRHIGMKKSEQKNLMISSIDVMEDLYAGHDGAELSIRQYAASMYEAVVFYLMRLNGEKTTNEKLQFLSDAGKFLHQLILAAARDPSVVEMAKKIWEQQQAEKKKAEHSLNGAKGLDVRHKPTRDLKEWAVEEARSMTGKATEIASWLYPRIPGRLQLPVQTVEQVERKMADAIREDRKKLRLAGQP